MPRDLSKINFKTIYYNQNDIEDFYSNSLLNANIYKRISAYFSVGIFKYLKRGIPGFIENDGYIQLILSEDIDSDAIKLINKGYENKLQNQYISKTEILKNIKKYCEDDDVNLFSYLIAIGKVDVKLVYKLRGIVHDKFGITSDGVHNLVYIGSANFTEAAAGRNDEAFQVTIDWENPSKRELQGINELNNLFDDIWHNKKEDVVTLDLPDPVINDLIDKIDYSEIKKLIKNPNYIRFDFDRDNNILLTSNIDIKVYLTYKNVGEFFSFLTENEKGYILKNINRINEIDEFRYKIKNICNRNNLSFFLTKSAKDYLDLHLRDYHKLAEFGSNIKSKNYLLTSDFENYKNDINNILKRPLKDIQVQAAIHIIKMEKSLNFSVPGSGKTATVLGAFEYLASRSKLSNDYLDKLLVVGPTNCAKSWQDEYQEVSFASNDYRPLCLINDDNVHLKEDVLLHDFQTSRIILLIMN